MTYRIEPGEERVEIRRRLEERVEGACGDEAKVEGRRRRRHHEKRVLHGHEEEKPQCEQAQPPDAHLWTKVPRRECSIP